MITSHFATADTVRPTGFISGRQAFDPTQRVITILHHARTKLMHFLLLSLDAEKTFNRIHWQHMHKTLLKCGFTGPILSAILVLCSSLSA